MCLLVSACCVVTLLLLHPRSIYSCFNGKLVLWTFGMEQCYVIYSITFYSTKLCFLSSSLSFIV